MNTNMTIDISIFNNQELFTATSNFFLQLGIKLNSNTAMSLPVKELLAEKYREEFNCIKKLYFAGIVDKSVFETTLSDQKYTIDDAKSIGGNAKNYEGLMIFALQLHCHPTRTQIANLSRAFNMKLKAVPTALLLKYDNFISLALPERFLYKQTWRDGEKIGKVIILRDINIEVLHAGHLRILQDLAIHKARNFNELHETWLKVLDVNILNKQFFQEISNWYFWAMEHVQFPDDKDKNIETRNATNLIRFITRIIFVWFIKEKGLVPEKLFDQNELGSIVKNFNKNAKSTSYYNAILQNLFFATLNQKMNERKFAEDGDFVVNRKEHGIKTHYRYDKLFVIEKTEAQKLFKQIPFLNGGLFDCLDKENPETNKVEYVDGFSRNSNKRAIIPDFLFFGEEQATDLNSVYDTRGRNYHVKGLFNILKSYKFTITENTPIEEEIALDPELLGKVFENLLASYNPETKITARKQTGSFYTPREIVEYMVDESLIAYLKNYILSKQSGVESFDSPQTRFFGNEHRKGQLKLERKLNQWADKEQELENSLRLLLSYNLSNPFDETDTATIIQAINNCNILDPACGSGAFPMGILHKTVLMLQKLDPENKKWKEQQRERIIGEKILELQNDKKIAAQLNDKQVREHAEKAVEERLQELNDIFDREYNFDDYARKLFLIENCIFGVDIQTIAIQIAKLRFFISLVVDQKANEKLENFGIRALPNLETKFVAANTLIGLDRPKQQMIGYQFIRELEKELKEIRSQYFIASTRKEKLNLQDKDRKLRNKIAQKLTEEGWDENVAKKIAMFDPYDQNISTDWFDPEWMFGVTQGVDIVIGNPPYVQLQNNSGALAKLYEPYQYVTFAATGDIYCLFYERGYNLLRDNGLVCFITSNKWMRAGYGEKTRNFLSQNTNPEQLIDFAGVKVFESATVDTNILLFTKEKNKEKTKSCIIKNHGIEELSVLVRQNTTVCKFHSADSWVVLSPIEQRIKAKIEAVGT
ncbi:MAG: Eco57I restriction-modification methylase domain-containing protein, partial [Planctomycetaceae bacterium]|nr:Eco57I restriction-modification methylase domain-containing protein [Planctomycetaceae bacterium]